MAPGLPLRRITPRHRPSQDLKAVISEAGTMALVGTEGADALNYRIVIFQNVIDNLLQPDFESGIYAKDDVLTT